MTFGLTNLGTRNAWIREQLSLIRPGSKILDAGAGELMWKNDCAHLDYLSQDVCEYNGRGDGKGLQCEGWKFEGIDVVCDIMNIPLESESFDAVMCTEVLDHVPDPGRALMELTRLLRKGGTLIVTESFCGLTNQSPYFYYTGLSENFYRHWLSGYDLSIFYNGNYYQWIAQEIHRLMSWKKMSQVAGNMVLQELIHASAADNNSHLTLCYGLLVKGVKNV